MLKRDRIEGLERLHYPVLFRDDTGACLLIQKGAEFLNHFEPQDLLDSQFFGWDSRHLAFHFRYSPSSESIVVEFGEVESEAIEVALEDYASHPESDRNLSAMRQWLLLGVHVS